MSESAFQRDAKPKSNTLRNFALTLCFTGLFLMLAGMLSLAVFVTVGGRTISLNFGYLFVVLTYLGLIVAALTASVFTFGPPEIERQVPAQLRLHIFEKRGARHPSHPHPS